MECNSQKNGRGAFSCSEVEWGKKGAKTVKEAVAVRMRELGQLNSRNAGFSALSEDQS
jgi:hypothetical protein